MTAVRSTVSGPFERGDILLSVGPHEVCSREDLLRALGRDMVDRRLSVSVWRDGRHLAFECTPSCMTGAAV